MPKVQPLGSNLMKARALEKRGPGKVRSKEDNLILEGFDVLQRRAGFKNKRYFAEDMGFTDRRYREIREDPGIMRLNEIRRVQMYAKKYDVNVCFSFTETERSAYGR